MLPRLGAVAADSGPMIVLASIAAAGSFTHIRDTANQHGQHGWMAWAVAVCIDLTCVMAARERQRDKRTERPVRGLSWPTLVLVGGIVLSLAANLAQAEPTTWGWLTAGTPAGAFLVAVSMLERRSSVRGPAVPAAPSSVPPSFGRPAAALVPVPDKPDDAAERAVPR
jgi:peptidoglycan/LPS O-acetylase OafA/YrhL